MVFVSDSASSRDVTGSKRSSTPRALIHKKILEAAGEMPGAPMAEVADEVSGASTDLVERVLREYGDPAAVESDPEEPTASDGGSASASGVHPGEDSGTGHDDPLDGESHEEPSAVAGDDSTTGSSETSASGSDDRTDAVSPGNRPDDVSTTEDRVEDETDETGDSSPEDLTEKEREVLEVVAERPAATQQEVADVLGVSRATVSKRASGIEGFDWQRRAAFVDRVFDGEAPLTRGASGSSTVDPDALARADTRADGDRTPPVDATTDSRASGDVTDEVLSRLDRIEERLGRLESGDASDSSAGIADPQLAHKVVHACMESEHVSEDEELQVVAAVLNGDAGD